MENILKINTAVISVSDKSGVVELAKFLVSKNIKIISTGGTGKLLKENGIDIIPISQITKNKHDEYFSGRMKTISFNFESSLLFKRADPQHLKQAEELGIIPIDLVVCNLYPFEKVIKKSEISIDEAIENIDIGGPCMIRAAAKNYEGVAIVVNPQRYNEIINEINKYGGIRLELRKKLMVEAYKRTAEYDVSIYSFFTKVFNDEMVKIQFFEKGMKLGRYAENWHQKGFIYVESKLTDEPNIPNSKKLHGGALGYNNYLDADAALRSVLEIKNSPCVSIIKHTNPCGFATGETLKEALNRSWQGDPVSSFGSIIGFNQTVDLSTIKTLENRFVEILICPKIDFEALSFIKNMGKKKEDLRILEYKTSSIKKENKESLTELRYIRGGLLEQDKDEKYYLTSSIEELFSEPKKIKCENSGKEFTVGIVTNLKPLAERGGLYDFALRHIKHVKSNAITIAREYETAKYQILGMGCGQPNRKDSVALAAKRAIDNLKTEFFNLTILKIDPSSDYFFDGSSISKRIDYLNKIQTREKRLYLSKEKKYVESELKSNKTVLVSDAFFPFRDSIDNIAEVKIKYVIAPGGSIRDSEVIKAANEHKMGMIFTGVRKFYH